VLVQLWPWFRMNETGGFALLSKKNGGPNTKATTKESTPRDTEWDRVPYRVRPERRHLGRVVVQHPRRLRLQPRLHPSRRPKRVSHRNAHAHGTPGDLRERLSPGR
jgi:hypothetical protein